MEPNLHDDKLIARYLLGELSEAEQAQLEERAFLDGDYLQQVIAVEKDLIDEYARDELSGTAREAFERRFLVSDQRRRQIQFAKAFAQVANESQARVSADEPQAKLGSWWSSVFVRRGSNMAVSFSLAAVALIVIIGGIWFLRKSIQSGAETARTQPTPQATPAVQENAPPSPAPDQHAQTGPQAKPPEERQAPIVASLVLSPGLSRGAENHPRLVITPATGVAQLHVMLQKGDEYKTYAVELRTASGRMVRSQTGLAAHPSPGGHSVQLALPASLLTTGEYELTLSGINEQKRAEPLGYYYFAVRKE